MRNEHLGLSIDQDARCTPCAVCGQQPAQCRCAGYHQQTNSCRNCGCTNNNSYTCNDCTAAASACGEHRCTGTCPCSECAAAQARCSARGRCDDCRQRNTPAMVYAAHHDAENTYSIGRAIVRGTVFPCLDKPMCREDSCNPCITEEQAVNFAAWDLRLYLNTHPLDEKALCLLRSLCKQAGDNSYACALLPGGCGCSQWKWHTGPWPWEYTPCCGKEG